MSAGSWWRRRLGIYTLSIAAALTAACGGGGGTSGTNLSSPTVEIDAQPQGVTVADGTSATFKVAATGESLSYLWRSNGVPIANASASTYTIAAAQYGQNGYKYSVSVYNSAGSVTSHDAVLTVTAVKPSITTPPTTQTVVAGGSATFSVVASGTTPMTYQWSKNGIVVPGAQNATWVYQSAKLADNGGKIAVTVSNAAGSASSVAVPLIVTSAVPVIVTQPLSQTVLAPASATFTTLVTGSPPLAFQWFRNNVAISGAINASYVTSPTTTSDNGEIYTVAVTNAQGSVTSVPATLSVTTLATAPSITTQPQNATAVIGDATTFIVVAGGTAPLSYQWQVNGSNLPGATGSSYTVSPVLAQDNQLSYSVSVSNSAGSATSSAAVLTVQTAATGISLIAGQLGGPGGRDGNNAVARFNLPEGVAIDSAGNVFVADTSNSAIREITTAGSVVLFAGNENLPGATDGIGDIALFNYPSGLAVDVDDNVYVADGLNHTIRKITASGVVTTIAGTPGTTGYVDGPGSSALFNFPESVAVDVAGNVFVADKANSVIRKITVATGNVSTVAGTAGVFGFADGPAATAQFNAPIGIAVDSSGNIYVADTYNDVIRVITTGTNPTVSTLAGSAGIAGSVDATGPAARFDHPDGVSVDTSGNVFVSDTNSGTIRLITSAGVVTTLAGTAYATRGSADGIGAAAQFNNPWAIATDAADNLYIADYGNDGIRKVATTGSVSAVTTYAGEATHQGTTNGAGPAALFGGPSAAAVDSAGNIYIADTLNDTVRKITPAGTVSVFAGSGGSAGSTDGTGTAAQFNGPAGLATDVAGNVYVADTGNQTIRKITPAGLVTTLAGAAGAAGSADGTGTAASFDGPRGIVVDAAGDLYVADSVSNIIRKITSSGVVTTVAGTAGTVGGADGIGVAAQFNTPLGLAIDVTGNVYIADSNNFTIRVLSAVTNAVTTLAGAAGQAGPSDGIGADARFNAPVGLALDATGNVYVVDSFWGTLRKVTPAGTVTTVTGVPGVVGVSLGPLPASFNKPVGVAFLPGALSEVQLVVVDQVENAVLKVTVPD